MAEPALNFVGLILQKILPLAADEISRAWGVKKDLQKLADKVDMMKALISDAQNKQSTSEAVQLWLKRLQSVARDAEIVLDDFVYEVLREKVENRKRDKLRSFFSSSNPISFRLEMANKIKNVSTSLEKAHKDANQIGLHPVQLTMTSADHKEDRLTDPFVVESEIVGREVEVSQVVRMLTSSEYKKDLPVISIIGMGGQGKTTLAQLVLKKDSVMKYFDKKIWVCVSDDFKVERLLNEMLQSLGEKNAKTTNREALVRRLQENLKGKRCLLVLDDVWNDNREKWDGMRRCLLATGAAPGSKILVTTRSDEIALAMQTSNFHHLKVLSDDYSWMLFEKLAFADGGARKTQDLMDIGKRILKKCGGVPLAIKVIGGLLYTKKDESEWLMIEKSKIWNKSTGVDDGVISVLKLSYENLPSRSVKQCFASCSLFPKDTWMEKERLIQIWMAQGLINHSKGCHLEMEEIGSNYFNILLQSSLLQYHNVYISQGIRGCKMHDLVHDLSLQVSNNCFFNTEDGMLVHHDNEVMHLTLVLNTRKTLKNMKGIPPKLRSLYLVGDAVLEDIFKMFRHLCVLIVKCYDTTNLPNAVGEMKHLRYLDIEATGITTLPDSFTKLYNLVTLRVNYLKEIPMGSGSLINLRHIHFNYGGKCLFPGIGQLANLRTLPFFWVSQDKGCQIDELEHLHYLKGKLKIYGLENVRSYESTAKANLSTKSGIQSLELYWDDIEEDCEDNFIDVMEGLQPHSNLKSLTIRGYKSSKFPSWMVTKNHLILLRNLVEIKLERLDKCEQLPSFGNFPYLERLEMVSLHNVKRIGGEFYGYENLDNPGSSSCRRERETINLFPNLLTLCLENMNNLEEWSDAMITSDTLSVKVFPNLKYLYIVSLPKLAVLPDMENLPSLRRLRITECRSLAGIRNLCSLTSLYSLSVSDCPDLDVSLDMKNPHSLSDLFISGCDKLNSSLSNNLEKFRSLESLKIFSDPASWAKGLHHLPNLRNLRLIGLSDGLDYFPWPFSISNVAGAAKDADSTEKHFVSLENLALSGWPKITSLPEQIQHLSTLRTLWISKFDGLKALPEWIGGLQNLEELQIAYCSNLKQLPSAEAIQRLTNLNRLRIIHCPLLAERCTRASGAEWPKIAHIRSISINYKKV